MIKKNAQKEIIVDWQNINPKIYLSVDEDSDLIFYQKNFEALSDTDWRWMEIFRHFHIQFKWDI